MTYEAHFRPAEVKPHHRSLQPTALVSLTSESFTYLLLGTCLEAPPVHKARLDESSWWSLLTVLTTLDKLGKQKFYKTQCVKVKPNFLNF